MCIWALAWVGGPGTCVTYLSGGGGGHFATYPPPPPPPHTHTQGGPKRMQQLRSVIATTLLTQCQWFSFYWVETYFPCKMTQTQDCSCFENYRSQLLHSFWATLHMLLCLTYETEGTTCMSAYHVCALGRALGLPHLSMVEELRSIATVQMLEAVHRDARRPRHKLQQSGSHLGSHPKHRLARKKKSSHNRFISRNKDLPLLISGPRCIIQMICNYIMSELQLNIEWNHFRL